VDQKSRAGTGHTVREMGTTMVFLGLFLLVLVSARAESLPTSASAQPSLTPVATVPKPSPTPSPSATLPGVQVQTTPRPTPQPASPPTRLLLPALDLDAPVVELPLEGKTWDMSGLTNEIAHLGGTANPGEQSNMVLAGHVTLRIGAGPFVHLERLNAGDIAIVYAGDEVYTYRVMSKTHVAPDDVSVVQPTSDPILTLLTCTTWDGENRTYTERVAVVARLVEEEIPWARSRISHEE